METIEHGRVRFAFSDRHGGVSAAPYGSMNLADHVGDAAHAVAENRRLAAKALGVGRDRLVFLNQVHGGDVAVADEPWPDAQAPSVDAAVTTQPGLVLAVLVADCTPVLLADPVAGVVGVAHAGRPGLMAGVVPATVEVMASLGASPERMIAHTGPAVCRACYEVPEAMRAHVVARIPGAWGTTRQGTASVDVPGGVWAQLRGAGIVGGRRCRICTRESPDHYSYRREGVTGRFAGFAWLEGN